MSTYNILRRYAFLKWRSNAMQLCDNFIMLLNVTRELSLLVIMDVLYVRDLPHYKTLKNIQCSHQNILILWRMYVIKSVFYFSEIFPFSKITY